MNKLPEKYKSSMYGLLAAMFLFFVFYSCSNNTNPVTTTNTQGGKLNIAADSTLNGENSTVIQTIASAVLYRFSDPNAIVKTASISNGVASFDLTSLSQGDYFIIFNDSTLHRAPIYISDISKSYNMKIAMDLRLSIILSLSGDTLYKFKTHAQSDEESEVWKYSNDQSTGRFSYAYTDINAKTLYIRYIDDGSLINSLRQSNNSYHGASFTSWDLGVANHGIGPDGDSTATRMMCGQTSCHPSFWVKPVQWSSITHTNGWCNKCHAGYAGACYHLYDKNQ